MFYSVSSVEPLKTAAYLYSTHTESVFVSTNHIDELKEKISAVRKEFESAFIDDSLKDLINKYLLKIERLITDYQIWGKEFLEESIKDFMSTSIFMKDVPKDNPIWAKMFALGNNMNTLFSLVESSNKIFLNAEPYIKGLLS